jgi:capsular polysaccharide biosynthesis protein
MPLMRTKESSIVERSPNGMQKPPSDYALVDLGDLTRAVLRRFWVVVSTVVLLTGATVGFSIVQTPTYDASTKIIIGQGGKLTQDPVAEAGLQDITDTMVVAVGTRPVAEGVISKLHLHKSPTKFLKDMSVQRLGATQFIEVTYTDTDPKRAQRVANTIGEVFSQEVAGVSPGPNDITASVWEPAAVPQSPADPDPIRNGLLALVLGLVLGMGLALLVDYLSVPGKDRKASRIDEVM